MVADSRKMIKRLPILINLAEKYHIDEHLNLSYLMLSPSQNFALINYLLDNNMPLVVNGKLNSTFSFYPGTLKSKFGIDLKGLMSKYEFNELDLNEEKEEKTKNEVR